MTSFVAEFLVMFEKPSSNSVLFDVDLVVLETSFLTSQRDTKDHPLPLTPLHNLYTALKNIESCGELFLYVLLYTFKL